MSKFGLADYLNRSELRERGWTNRAIEQFLPEPERTEQNHYHRTGPPIESWRRSTVEATERTAEFIRWRQNSARRKAAAAKAIRTKQLMADISLMEVTVPIMDRETLLATAIVAAQDIAADHGDYECKPNPERAAVNYLRHECSNYEYKMRQIVGTCGTTKAIARLRGKLRGKIYAAIARAYPFLADECKVQAENRNADY